MSSTYNADCSRWPWPYPLIPTIPQIYMDAVSVEQQIKDLHCWLNSLSLYVTTELDYSGEIETLTDSLNELEQQFNTYAAGAMEPYYQQLLETWLNDNSSNIYQLLSAMVFFGLNDDGYFVAYIPDGWDDITFGTILDYTSDDYGKLTLSY